MSERHRALRSSGPGRRPVAARRTTRSPILVVDDSAEFREAVCATLESEGYPTVGVENGASAIEYMRRGPRPALILLDLVMPVMDGWAFVDVRRKDPKLSEIPVVVLSSAAGPSRVGPYVGVAAVIAKPATPARIVETVRRFCGSSADATS